MDQFVLILCSIYQSQSTLPKFKQKQEKMANLPKDFDSIYSAVNARLKTSNNNHLIDQKTSYSIIETQKNQL